MPRRAIGGSRRHVILSQPQEKWLGELARETGISPSEHIRRAIDTYRRVLESHGQGRKAREPDGPGAPPTRPASDPIRRLLKAYE